MERYSQVSIPKYKLLSIFYYNKIKISLFSRYHFEVQIQDDNDTIYTTIKTDAPPLTLPDLPVGGKYTLSVRLVTEVGYKSPYSEIKTINFSDGKSIILNSIKYMHIFSILNYFFFSEHFPIVTVLILLFLSFRTMEQ